MSTVLPRFLVSVNCKIFRLILLHTLTYKFSIKNFEKSLPIANEIGGKQKLTVNTFAQILGSTKVNCTLLGRVNTTLS